MINTKKRFAKTVPCENKILNYLIGLGNHKLRKTTSHHEGHIPEVDTH